MADHQILFENDVVSPLRECQSEDAAKLCITNISYKLKQNMDFDIGGTYKGNEKEFWFYFTTSICHGDNFLLNLFVCHRVSGNFKIKISNSNYVTHTKVHGLEGDVCTLSDIMKEYTFRTAQPDENYFIKTFCFFKKDIENPEVLKHMTLLIPIKIDTSSLISVNSDIVNRIKLSHNSLPLLEQVKADFVLTSQSGSTFPVHKIVLAAHSPILRNILEHKESSKSIDISNTSMELLLQFLYTGTIKDFYNCDYYQLLDIAVKFELENLLELCQDHLSEKINVSNAVELALLSQNYKLEQLQNDVFQFITKHPEVTTTEGWKKLVDIDLAKKLYVYYSKCSM